MNREIKFRGKMIPENKSNTVKNASNKNSIERDIHLLESYAGMTHKMTDNQGRPKLDQAIERVLLDYKRVLKENESLQKTYDDCYCKYKHYKQFESISVQKVKDKIEELKEKEESDYGFVVETLLALQTLQELLEESEE